MATAVLARPSQAAGRRGPAAGFFSGAVTPFETAAKVVAKLTPERLLFEIERDAAVADRKDALKRIDKLERVIGQIRERLQQVPEPVLDFSEADRATDDRRRELLGSAAFAARLGLTRQALSKALAARRVFFVEHQRARYFPAFYADKRYDRRHLEAITKLLGDLPGGAKLQFFLNARASLSKRTPLQALERGQLAEVKAAAEAFVQG
jgi:hypothetical protein